MSDTVPSRTAADPLEDRSRIGSFEILREDGKLCLLGKGSFGRTFKARHVYLDRLVALKIIHDKFLTDSRQRESFLAEARAAARLSHPYIAQILDFGEDEGALYYAMEYCSGGDLAAHVKRHGPLPAAQAVRVGLQVAHALQCAHGAGFIHRDLKPSNLMLASPEGPLTTKLIDFGLVIAAPTEQPDPLNPEDVPTIEQRFFGTTLFASPEQLLVQPLDARSDFFSLGMTLWFLIAGSAPDPGNSDAIVRSRLSEESYASRLPPNLPQSFHTVLAKLLEKNAEDRFANAGELCTALARCAAGLGLPADPMAAYSAAAASSSTDSGTEGPATVETIGTPVGDFYTMHDSRGGNLTGIDYDATSPNDGKQLWLHLLKPVMASNSSMFERIRQNIGWLQRSAPATVERPLALRSHPDRMVVVFDAPGGTDLASESQTAGPILLTDARLLLHTIASACDAVVAAGLPAPELDPQRVFVRLHAEAATPATALASAEPRLIPRFLPGAVPPSTESAALVYRLLSGRELPNAPAISPQDCEPIECLSAEGNRILALAIAGQHVHPTCGALLTELLITEGLLSASPTHHSGTATASAGRSKTAGRPKTDTATAARETRQTRETHATAPPASTADRPPPFSPKLTAQPAAAPAPAKPPVSPPKPPVAKPPGKRPLWLPIAAGALAVLIGIVLIVSTRKPKEKSQKLSDVATTGSGPAAGKAGAPIPGLTPPARSGPRDVIVKLRGELPPHTVARAGDQEITFVRKADGVHVTVDGSISSLTFAAAAFMPIKVDLTAAGDLEREHEVKRMEGKLIFKNRQQTDYELPVAKMVDLLPEDRSLAESERYSRSINLNIAAEMLLPTGVYQLTLRGGNDSVVRSRRFSQVTVRAGETQEVELPLTMAGGYSGEVTPPRGGAPYKVEMIIERGLEGGTFIEYAAAGTRRARLDEGRLDGEGVFLARIKFSDASGGPATFDQLCSLRRNENGSLAFESSEAPDENTPIETQLGRQPFPKASAMWKGTLRPDAATGR